MSAEKKITARDIRDMLEVRYALPEWHCDHELTHAGRRLDTLAFRLWGGGKGYRLLGFEIKVSRGDWLHELTQIEKARAWAAVVDEFYVVAIPGIVQIEELPRGWGLLEVRKTRLFVKAHPAQREWRQELHREVVARMMQHTLSRVGVAEHIIEDRLRPAVEAQVLSRLQTKFTRDTEAVVAKATAYDALMQDAGLSKYNDPVEVLKGAHRVVKAMQSMPAEWSMQHAGTKALEVAQQINKSVGQLEEALHEFRVLEKEAQC